MRVYKSPVPLGTEIFTTGQVARACNLSATKIRELIDEGKLKARRIPFSKHRRVDRKDLDAFMVKDDLGWRNGR